MARSVSRSLIPVGVLAAVTAGVVLAANAGGGADAAGPGGGDLGSLETVALSSFSSCDAVLDYYRTQAAKLVGPYGLGDGRVYAMESAGGAVRDSAAGASPAAPGPGTAGSAAAAPGSNGAGTGTNVQVAGVDEADLAKVVDGRLYSLTDGVLRVTDLAGGSPEVLASLTLKDWYADQMLVAGTHLLLTGSGGYAVADLASDTVGGTTERLIAPGSWMPQSRVADVDISDPAHPRLSRVVDLDGWVVGARLVDGVARLAVSASSSRLPFVYPSNDSKAAQALAEKTNKEMVASSTLEDWLPQYVERGISVDGRVSTGGTAAQLVDCRDLAAPKVFSGLDTLTLMTVDLAGGGLAQWDSAGVVASGAMLYATAERTYVATSPWGLFDGRFGASPTLTQIHVFSTANDAPPAYLASGTVRGTLLGQYAMDEQDGVLRVASTTQPSGGGVVEPNADTSTVAPDAPSDAVTSAVVPKPSSQVQSESLVTTLRVDGDSLAFVGSVGGLGKGETIRSVRFLGDVGYVVTYRQTDPLYTIDLSDPAAPRVAGELKLLGYSGYLHPAGDGLLLGIGQDGTKDGATTGLQLSLFDVTDPANPTRVDQVKLPAAWSSADGDAHAFTYVGGLALAPFETWADVTSTDNVYRTRFDAGVVAVRVDGRTLSPEQVLRPKGDGPVVIDPSKDSTGQDKDKTLGRSVLRTYVVDGTVYALTTGGIATFDAATLARTGFTTF